MDEPVLLTLNGRRKCYLPQNAARYKAKENRYSGNGLVSSVACTHNSSSCSAVTLKESDLLYRCISIKLEKWTSSFISVIQLKL